MADDTGEQLITVAREILAKRGYLGLTMKTAAAAAGVTPDVARRYYRNRDALVAAALRLPSDPIAAIPTLVAPGVEGMGERLVRYMLDILRDPQTRDELVSLARTGVNAGHAMLGLQDFLERAVVDRVTSMIGVPDARMRSALITSYLLGVAMTRYGVRLEPLASASEEEVVRMVAPVIQDLLDPRKPLPGSARARSQTGAPAASAAPAARRFDPDPKATAARAAREAQRSAGATSPPPARPAPAPRGAPAAGSSGSAGASAPPEALRPPATSRAKAPAKAPAKPATSRKATAPAPKRPGGQPAKGAAQASRGAAAADQESRRAAGTGPKHAAPDGSTGADAGAAPIPAPRPQEGEHAGADR